MELLNYIEGQRVFYDNRTIEIPGNENYSQSELIHSINCARLSKYRDDNAHDDIIGDYPYDNISKYRIRLEARATDFDPKHVEVEPLNGSREARISAMIGTKVLRKHMRQTNFGAFLDDYANTRPEYGGFLAKKTEDGVVRVPWENVITDMSNIMGGVIIERHYMLPSELKKQNWKNVDEVIASASERKKKQDMKEENAETDTITDLIEIWELHGEVTKAAYLEAEAEFEGKEYEPKDEDELEFVSCQVILAPLGKNEDDEMTGYVLQANEEGPLSDTYRYDARNPIVGRGLGEGIPEELSEHQRWHNFYKTEEARAVAIGGKVLFVTDDGNVVDTVYDSGIEHGTIMKVGEGKDFRQLNTLPTAVPLYGDIRADWNNSGDRVTSSFDTKLGEDAKSGTTFRGQYLLDENANSQFLQYREQMGRFIREIVEEWVLPQALAEARKEDEIYDTFSKAELQMIDEVIVNKAMTDRMAKILLEEKRAISPEEQEAIQIGLQTALDRMGNKRSIDGIKAFLKDEVIKNVVIHTTDEDRSKAVLFESYSNLLNLLEPGSAEFQAVKDKIMDMLGITRDELALYADEAQALQQKQMQMENNELIKQDTQQKQIPL